MNEITINRGIIQTFDEAERAARAMAGSGFFQDAKAANQAIVKILAGQELGFGAFASMTGVAIIQGKPAIGANLQAAAVKRTGKYNYRITEMSNEACEVAFLEAGQEVGRSRFTMEDAKAAQLTGKDNWRKFPRNMLFARAISNGVKWYAPDIFNGATVYTPDELGAVEDADGNIISQPAPIAEAEVITTPTEFHPDKARGENMTTNKHNSESPKAQPAQPSARPYAADVLQGKIQTTIKAAALDGKASVQEVERKILAAALGKIFPDSTQRYEVSEYLTGTSSTKKMTAEAVFAVLKWLGNGNAQAVNFDYQPDDIIRAEANAAHTAALIAKGQQTLI